MRVLSLCSGIGADALAFHPLGWQTIGFFENADFPSAVLTQQFPTIWNFGDINNYENWQRFKSKTDLIIGGTPCQSFSTAGLRGGMDDARGGLAMQFCRIVECVKPRWFIWENVPGIISVDSGKAFKRFIGALAKSGYGICWRIVDAEDWVPQRRKRLIVVGYFGSWQRPAAVLFVPARGGGDTPPCKKTQINPVAAKNDQDIRINRQINDGKYIESDETSTLRAGQSAGKGDLIYYRKKGFQSGWCESEHASTLNTRCGNADNMNDVLIDKKEKLRYITPIEAERFMGMPDNHTQIIWRGKPASDCPKSLRYKAIGNSIVVPMLADLGRRIAFIESAT